ncbi:MAG: beta strand repeat-containing protein [Beijerinckiaceae bacterium]
MSTVTGTSGNDSIGSAGNSTGVTGGLPTEGADTLTGNAGSDNLDGGGGNDLLNPGTFFGVSATSSLPQADTVDGGGGIDTVFLDYRPSATSINIAFLTHASQSGQTLSDGTILRNIEIISVLGSNLNDTFAGGAGNDTLQGGLGSDLLMGGDGDDSLAAFALPQFGTAGTLMNDTLDGGDGYDTGRIGALFTASRTTFNLDFSLAATSTGLAIGGALLRNIEVVDFSSGEGNDSLVAGSGNDTIRGGGGYDTLIGGGGDDFLALETGLYISPTRKFVVDGGIGIDKLDVSQLPAGTYDFSGAESAAGAAISAVSGEVRNIEIINFRSTTGNGQYNLTLGTGQDYAFFVGNYTLQIRAGAGDDLIEVETSAPGSFFGEDGDDVIGTGEGSDHIDGGAGNDSLSGGSGSDALIGGSGADTLFGSSGNDFLYIDEQDSLDGGADYDAVFIQTTVGTMLNVGLSQVEYVVGFIGNDTLNGSTSTVSVALIGGDGADVLRGGSDNDYLYIDAADVTIDAGAGLNDVIVVFNETNGVNLNITAANAEYVIGGSGNDILNAAGSVNAVAIQGGNGADTITGGNASDYLYGNAGGDVFRVTANAQFDAILDFTRPGGADNDRINVSALGTNFDSIGKILVATTDYSGTSVIDFGNGNQLYLLNVAKKSLTADDFIF